MRLLIVEDQDWHLESAADVVARLKDTFGLEAMYAETLEDALKSVDWAEAVVTDLFFPEKPGESPDPPSALSAPDGGYEFAEAHISGVKLAKRCFELKKPVVVCTSTYSHGWQTQPACIWLDDHEIVLVDKEPEWPDGINDDAPTKDWTEAILLAIVIFEKAVRRVVDVGEHSSSDEYCSIANFSSRPENGDMVDVDGILREASPTVAEVLRRYDAIPK